VPRAHLGASSIWGLLGSIAARVPMNLSMLVHEPRVRVRRAEALSQQGLAVGEPQVVDMGERGATEGPPALWRPAASLWQFLLPDS
jgi:hypothetical protein